MGDLILSDFVKSDGEKAKTTSFKIAEKFDKEHKDVLKAIRNLECSESFNQRNFAPISYLDSYGRNQISYEMTRDGFMFLAMGFTGEKAAAIKESFIEAFNLMESVLKGTSPKIRESLVVFETSKAFGSHFGLSGNQLLLSANKATKELTGFDPMSALGITHLISESQEAELTPTELGKRVGLSAQAINKLLAEKGLQEKTEDKWIATNKGKRFAIVLDTGKKHSNGAPVQQIKWKESVTKEIAA